MAEKNGNKAWWRTGLAGIAYSVILLAIMGLLIIDRLRCQVEAIERGDTPVIKAMDANVRAIAIKVGVPKSELVTPRDFDK
jgi:hypothetical protein